MIETTLGSLLRAEAAIGRLLARTLPVRCAYDTAKLARLIEPELQQFYKLKDDLIREHAGDDGKVKPEHMGTVQAKLTELVMVPVELPARPVDLNVIDAMTPEDILALGPLAKFPDDEDPPGAQ